MSSAAGSVTGEAGCLGVREWQPQATVLRRFRLRAGVIGAAVVAAYGALLAGTGSDRVSSVAILSAVSIFMVAVIWVRKPTATGAPPQRSAIVLQPETVPPPTSRDAPRERRGRQARAAAAVLLLVTVLQGSGGDIAVLPASALSLMVLADADLPWLWLVRSLDRRSFTRAPLTVRMDRGAPSAGRVVLSSGDRAWTAVREGVLYDAVAGDVLVADLNPADGSPVVLTLAGQRTIGPVIISLTPERFRALVGEDV